MHRLSKTFVIALSILLSVSVLYAQQASLMDVPNVIRDSGDAEQRAGAATSSTTDRASTDQQLNGLIALKAMRDAITSLMLAAGTPVSPGFLTGGWTGSVTSSGWNVVFHGQMGGIPVDLTEIGMSTGGSHPDVKWTDTGMVQGSGEISPISSSALRLDVRQKLSVCKAPGGVLTKSTHEAPCIFIIVVIIIGILCLYHPERCSGSSDFIASSQPPTSVGDVSYANFDTGAVYSQDIVNEPHQFALVQQGTVAFGGSGDLSVDDSVQAVLFSDFSTTSNRYECCIGFPVAGSGTIGSSFTAANLFTLEGGGAQDITTIDIGIGYVANPPTFDLQIYTDNGNLPGVLLYEQDGLESTTAFKNCCDAVTINPSGLTLTGGTQYFIVLRPVSLTDTSELFWNTNSLGVTGLDLYSGDGGQTWISNGEQRLGAFDILGMPTGTAEHSRYTRDP